MTFGQKRDRGKEICHAHNGKKQAFQAEVTTNAKSVR